MNKTPSLQKSLPILAELLQRFAPELKQQKPLIWLASMAVLADVGLRILEPWPLKIVFDHVLTKNPLNLAIIGQISPVFLLTLCAITILVITALRAFAAYGSTVALATIGSRVMTQIRDRLYCHLQQLSLSYHTQARSGDLIIRISSDTSRLQEILITATLPLIVSILTLVGTVGVMFWIDRDLTLLSLITLPFFAFSVNRLSQRIQESSLKQRQREGMLAATAGEAMASIKLIQALSLENAFFEVFSRQNRRSSLKSIETQRLSASLERTVDGVIALGVAIVLWYGSWLVLRDHLTTGDVIVFLTYLKNAFKPVQNLAKYTGRLAKSAASAERVLNILDQIPEIQDLPNAQIAPAFRGEVRGENLCFSYDSGRKIFDELNFTVQPGQFVAVVGASGCGKSTLMGLLLRLYEPSGGRILIDGEDIRNYTLASVRSQISIVLQETLLFAATIRENIAYGIPNVTEEEIIAAAKLANAHDFIIRLPQGYDTLIGERGATLSGGQRQRVAIARAAIRHTPILILDEPTTGLDQDNEQAVMEALQKLAQGRTTFLITHDLSLAKQANLIIYVEKSEISHHHNTDNKISII
jgi:ATP-binding cassette subfamily B protein